MGRSDLESIEIADRVRTAVTPNVTLSDVASLLSQNPTQDKTTMRAQGRYTWTQSIDHPVTSFVRISPESRNTLYDAGAETQLEAPRMFQLIIGNFCEWKIGKFSENNG